MEEGASLRLQAPPEPPGDSCVRDLYARLQRQIMGVIDVDVRPQPRIGGRGLQSSTRKNCLQEARVVSRRRLQGRGRIRLSGLEADGWPTEAVVGMSAIGI